MEQDPLERVHAPEEVRVTAPAEMAKADSEAAAESDAEVLVAVPTIPAGRPSRLTRDEAAVTTLALAGRANKYIAYELGVAQSTVSARLNRAMAKLMVENRAQLQQRYGTTALLESSAA